VFSIERQQTDRQKPGAQTRQDPSGQVAWKRAMRARGEGLCLASARRAFIERGLDAWLKKVVTARW
jgi:hypothetical protein